jgi:dienelactone hydrolase
MATIILLIAFVVEAAFAAYCMVTHSNQVKVRSLIRIGALAAFVLFSLAAVIQWSFRWYALAALLLVWAALGAWALVRHIAEKKGYPAWRSAVRAVAMLVLVFIVLLPALIFPQYRPPRVTGDHAVATVQYTYTDESRIETFTNTSEKRKVNVEFWYPKDGGSPQETLEKYPLVVFSPGSFGTKTSNTSTFIELASNGYVVCSIDHPYHAFFTIGTDRRPVLMDRSFYQEVVDVNKDIYDQATEFKIEKKWMELQTADINFALDTILAQVQEPESDPVYQLIDPGKIGLMGHSLGGESSAQVARERAAGEQEKIGAVVNLDADLGGEYLDYVDGKYCMDPTVYPVPILTILADDMVRLLDAIPEADTVVAVQHVTASAPDAYEIHIAGTDHQSLTDLALVSPFLVSVITGSVQKAGGGETADKLYVIETMNDLVLEFFNAYLKGEGSFSRYVKNY